MLRKLSKKKQMTFRRLFPMRQSASRLCKNSQSMSSQPNLTWSRKSSSRGKRSKRKLSRIQSSASVPMGRARKGSQRATDATEDGLEIIATLLHPMKLSKMSIKMTKRISLKMDYMNHSRHRMSARPALKLRKVRRRSLKK